MKTVTLPDFPSISFSNNNPFVLIAGPCSIESTEHAHFMASSINSICQRLDIPYIFKASFDKANRTSVHSKRGVGIDKGTSTLRSIRKKVNVPVLTDVHEVWQCRMVYDSCDIIQIPAFLSRQTDLLLEAAGTNRVINIKKGQFMAPWDIAHSAEKVASTGNENILLTERGVSFGYNTLINDMRGLVQMAETGYPVIFDATHSVQQPSGQGGTSGGQREFVFPLARAAVAVGVAGLFMEVHDKPEVALSDGPNMVRLNDLENMLVKLKEIDAVVK